MVGTSFDAGPVRMRSRKIREVLWSEDDRYASYPSLPAAAPNSARLHATPRLNTEGWGSIPLTGMRQLPSNCVHHRSSNQPDRLRAIHIPPWSLLGMHRSDFGPLHRCGARTCPRSSVPLNLVRKSSPLAQTPHTCFESTADNEKICSDLCFPHETPPSFVPHVSRSTTREGNRQRRRN